MRRTKLTILAGLGCLTSLAASGCDGGIKIRGRVCGTTNMLLTGLHVVPRSFTPQEDTSELWPLTDGVRNKGYALKVDDQGYFEGIFLGSALDRDAWMEFSKDGYRPEEGRVT